MENLVIKREPSPDDIKAKLNLHVKRRLQDFGHGQDDVDQHHNASKIHSIDHKSSKDRNHKEIRQKRPYHKRTDKKLTTSCSSHDVTATQRKYKPKFKQQRNPDIEVITPTFQDDSSMPATSLNTGGVTGDEDEDLRAAREKENSKCPDVLGMVLSMKKRALFQDPEVQKFLTEVMKVIKS